MSIVKRKFWLFISLIISLILTVTLGIKGIDIGAYLAGLLILSGIVWCLYKRKPASNEKGNNIRKVGMGMKLLYIVFILLFIGTSIITLRLLIDVIMLNGDARYGALLIMVFWAIPAIISYVISRILRKKMNKTIEVEYAKTKIR